MQENSSTSSGDHCVSRAVLLCRRYRFPRKVLQQEALDRGQTAMALQIFLDDCRDRILCSPYYHKFEQAAGAYAKMVVVRTASPLPVHALLHGVDRQLEALPDLYAACATREGRQIVEATAGLLLPRVHHLAPGFPFDALLDEFATPEEEAAAIAAVRSVVEAVKAAARRD